MFWPTRTAIKNIHNTFRRHKLVDEVAAAVWDRLSKRGPPRTGNNPSTDYVAITIAVIVASHQNGLEGLSFEQFLRFFVSEFFDEHKISIVCRQRTVLLLNQDNPFSSTTCQ